MEINHEQNLSKYRLALCAVSLSLSFAVAIPFEGNEIRVITSISRCLLLRGSRASCSISCLSQHVGGLTENRALSVALSLTGAFRRLRSPAPEQRRQSEKNLMLSARCLLVRTGAKEMPLLFAPIPAGRRVEQKTPLRKRSPLVAGGRQGSFLWSLILRAHGRLPVT